MSVHYKELSDRAFKYHNSGEYDKAKELYLQLLAINPDDPNILNLLGMLYLSLKDTTNAINYISKSFLLKQNAYVAGNLAKAYFLSNDLDKALKFFKTALSYGETCDLYYSLAFTYKKLNDIDSAIKYYIKALEINPNHYNSLFNLSIAYSIKNETDNAIFYAEICKKIKENDEIYALLSEYYQTKSLTDVAIECLLKAISYNSNKYSYYYNLGSLYIKKRKLILESTLNSLIEYFNLIDKKLVFIMLIQLLTEILNCEIKAVNAYKNSIKLNIHHINSYINLANILMLQNKTDNCISCLNLLIKMNPDCTCAFGMLANSYMDISDYKNALIYYNKAIEVSGEDLTLLKGKAVALKYSGNIDEAEKVFIKINKNYPEDISSKISLGMCYLSKKKFKEGYELYKYRSKNTTLAKQFKNKIWKNGISLQDKNVLIYTDCGYGDSIMYARYINELSKYAKSITLQTDAELIELFKDNIENINIIKKDEKPPKYDIVLPVMDIQYALNMDFSSIPYSQGYLKAKNNNILNSDKTKIGLYWKGSDKIIKNRSIPFQLLKELTGNKKYDFYSFQIDENVEEIYNLNRYIKDFSDSANLLTEMDLLITIDSSIAHLAGALGVKTWLLLPYVSEWRWFNDTQKTPWYDSLRIFKQDEIDNWDKVISEVKKELDEYEN